MCGVFGCKVMAWIPLTENDIKARMSAQELTVWDTSGQDSGEVISRIPSIITQVTGLVRGRVASCRESTLGAACLIPEELLYAAATLAKNAILNSLPTSEENTSEGRAEENRQANAQLDQAAKCELQITGEDSTTTANQVESTFGGDPLLTF
jgi:hypothetical protein